MADRKKTFYDVVREAIADILANGFDSEARITYWSERLRKAAEESLTPIYDLRDDVAKHLASIFKIKVEGGKLLQLHPGVPRFTIERVKPRLRAALDRSIMASADMIKLNRAKAVHDTVQRFVGWSTSIPAGGTDAADKVKAGVDLRKAIKNLPFTERRVAIDQGHKFISNLSNILATDGGALAAEWDSNWRQKGYDYREDHKERDGKVYAIRDNIAIQKGLMKKGPNPYTDQITKPGEEVYCRCSYTYIYLLSDLPADMLTIKGKESLARIQEMLGV